MSLLLTGGFGGPLLLTGGYGGTSTPTGASVIIPGVPAVPVTSGTVGQTAFDALSTIEEAFRRAGKVVSTVSAEQLLAAKLNLYTLLSELANRGLSLWCVKQVLLGLLPNQSGYGLPVGTVDILNVQRRILSRIFPATYDPTDPMFDGLVTTAIPQGSPNGNVVLALASASLVSTIGYIAGLSQTSTLVLETSPDGVTWYLEQSLGTVTTLAGNWYWTLLDPMPVSAYFRVRETGGGTISFGELVLGTTQSNIPLSQLSRDDYVSLPSKERASILNQYWYDKQFSTPRLCFDHTPIDAVTTLMSVWIQRQIQDIGDLTNQVEIPQRWYEAVVSLLGARIGMSLPDTPPAKVTFLLEYGETAVKQAENSETDGASIRWLPHISAYTRRR